MSFFFQNEDTLKKFRYSKNPIFLVTFGFEYCKGDALKDDQLKDKIREYISNVSDGLDKDESDKNAPQEKADLYEFSMKNGWIVRMDNLSFSVTAPNYSNWQDFYNISKSIFDGIHKIYGVENYQKVYLNFVDIIDPTELNVEPVWGELIRPELLGVLVNVPSDKILGHFHTINVALDLDSKLELELQHGTVFSVLDDAHKVGYLLDMCFKVSEIVVANEVFDVLKDLSRYSCQLFRWCISDQLHHTLEPTLII